jgi:hypothetical protein
VHVSSEGDKLHWRLQAMMGPMEIRKSALGPDPARRQSRCCHFC